MPHQVQKLEPVNLAQLSYELQQATGGPPPALRAVPRRWVRDVGDTLDPALFAQVVRDHVADPDWQPPEAPKRGLLRRLLRRS